MAYARPAILTVGDVVSEAYMTQIRDNSIAYETHGHTGSTDGAQLTTFDIFGDASDGNATITGGTTTLASGKNYNNLTIEASGILDTAGFIVRVKGVLTMSAGAVLHNDGSTGSGRTSPGAGGPKGDYPAGGRIGRVGWFGDTIPGGPLTGLDATNEDETETESDGGGGGNFSGGGTGAIGEGPAYGGAGGGGGGAAAVGDNSQGGSGGGGGGPVDIRTAEIAGTGTIRSKGGSGASASSTVGGGAGGGGGGGGGWIRIISLIAIPGTITRTVAGGSGGGGINGGSAGATGAAGRIENIELTL